MRRPEALSYQRRGTEGACGRIRRAFVHRVVDAVDGGDMRQVSLALSAAVIVVALLGGAAAGLVGVGPVLATSATSDCATGGAVFDADNNPGLVSDCEALLASRDTLAGSATLNWSADTSIAHWDGVTVGGVPRRVTGLQLNHRQLTGEIPAELGDLSPNPPMRSGLGVGTRGEGRGTRRSALDSDKWGRWRPLVVVGGADGGPGQRRWGGVGGTACRGRQSRTGPVRLCGSVG